MTDQDVGHPEGTPVDLPLLVCVDDEPGALASLTRALSREPYRVLATANPYEALSLAGRSRVSVVIADQRMPDMSGISLLRLVESRSPSTRRVLVTGLPDPRAVADSAGTVVERWFGKPWDDEELRRGLRSLVETPPAPSPGADSLFAMDGRGFLREWVCWLEAEGKTSFNLLARVALSLMHPGAAERGLVILVRNLPRLADAPEIFLRGLQAGLARHRSRSDLVDESGRAGALVRSGFEPSPWLRIHSARPRKEWAPGLLLVLPDPVELGFLRFVFSARGFRCVPATTAKGALRRLEGGAVETALVDGGIHGRAAETLLEALAERGKPPEVVLLSRESPPWNTGDRFWWRIRGCLDKPYTLQEVLDAVGPAGRTAPEA